MTIKKLYEKAKELNALDYDICYEVDIDIVIADVKINVAEFDEKDKIVILS